MYIYNTICNLNLKVRLITTASWLNYFLRHSPNIVAMFMQLAPDGIIILFQIALENAISTTG